MLFEVGKKGVVGPWGWNLQPTTRIPCLRERKTPTDLPGTQYICGKRLKKCPHALLFIKETHTLLGLCFPSCQRPDRKKVNPQKNKCVIYAKQERSRRYRGFVMKSSLCPGVSENCQVENRSSVTHPPLLCAVSCQHRKLLAHWNAVSPQYPNSQPTGRFTGHSPPHWT